MNPGGEGAVVALCAWTFLLNGNAGDEEASPARGRRYCARKSPPTCFATFHPGKWPGNGMARVPAAPGGFGGGGDLEDPVGATDPEDEAAVIVNVTVLELADPFSTVIDTVPGVPIKFWMLNRTSWLELTWVTHGYCKLFHITELLWRKFEPFIVRL